MNPSSDVCKAIFIPNENLGLIHVILFSKLIISVQITLFFFTLAIFWWGESKLYWNGGSAFILMPCYPDRCCISAYQQWMSPFSASLEKASIKLVIEFRRNSPHYLPSLILGSDNPSMYFRVILNWATVMHFSWILFKEDSIIWQNQVETKELEYLLTSCLQYWMVWADSTPLSTCILFHCRLALAMSYLSHLLLEHLFTATWNM